MRTSIREVLNRDPFQPFRIILTSGDRFNVTDPSLAVMMESQVFLAEPRSDHFHILRPNQIAAIESLPAAA
jgi:hypothetical protein